MKYLALVAACLAAAPALAPAPEHGDGFKSITEDDLEAHLIQLCTAPLEGRGAELDQVRLEVVLGDRLEAVPVLGGRRQGRGGGQAGGDQG